MLATLVLTDARSDKFWHIDTDGCDVTVHYGRRGTDGQTRTKTYATPAEATAAADTQIVEKRQKGYVDEEPGVTARPASSSAEPGVVADPGKGRVRAATSDPGPESSNDSGHEQRVSGPMAHDDIGLWVSPFDAAMNVDHEVTPIPRGPDQFDRESATALGARTYICGGPDFVRQAPEPLFDHLPGPDEAQWWRDLGRCDDKTAAGFLAGGSLDPDASERTAWTPGQESAIQAVLGGPPQVPTTAQVWAGGIVATRWWLAHAEADDVARARLEAEQSITSSYDHPDPALFTHLVAARVLGVDPDLTEARWTDLVDNVLPQWNYPQTIHISALTTAPTVADRVARASRTRIRPHSPAEIVIWVVSTGRAGLSRMADWIEDSGSRDEADGLIGAAAGILHGPGAVNTFARMVASTRAGGRAGDWLAGHIDAVLAARVHPSHAPVISAVLSSVPTERLRAARAAATGTVADTIDDLLAEPAQVWEAAPEWWKPAPAATLPDWLDVASCRPLATSAGRLPDDAVTDLLRTAQSGAATGLGAAAGEAAVDRTGSAFATQLLGQWLVAGAPAKDQWVMMLAAQVSGDAYATQMAPMLNRWPVLGQSKKAQYGLDCLVESRATGALQLLAKLANGRGKLAGPARVRLDRLAVKLDLPPDALEDRLVPDCGLADDGTRVFDFGSRRFLAGIGPDTKPALRDLDASGKAVGKPRTALPVPNAGDDAALAKQTKQEFTAFKKAVTETARATIARMQRALVSGRGWNTTEHQQFIGNHPLLRSLLAGLVWSGHNDDDEVVWTAVLGDGIEGPGVLVDTDDRDVPDAGWVRVAHPVELEPQVVARWRTYLADNGLAQPFVQLDLPVPRVPDQPVDWQPPFLPATLPQSEVRNRLRGAGWQAYGLEDAGLCHGHYLDLGSDWRADLEHDGLWIGMTDGDVPDVTLHSLKVRHDYTEVAWAEVPPRLASTVLTAIDGLVTAVVRPGHAD